MTTGVEFRRGDPCRLDCVSDETHLLAQQFFTSILLGLRDELQGLRDELGSGTCLAISCGPPLEERQTSQMNFAQEVFRQAQSSIP